MTAIDEPHDMMPVTEVVALMARVEQALADIDINERLNVLGYCIAGYIVAEFQPADRVSVAKTVGKTITFVYLPACADIQARLGGAFEPAQGNA